MSAEEKVGPSVSTVSSVRIATRAASLRTLRSKEIPQETPQTFAHLIAISRSERPHPDPESWGRLSSNYTNVVLPQTRKS